MKKQIKLEYLFAAVLVAFGLIGATAQAGKYAREPEKCGPFCQRKAEEAKQNREDRWDAYVAKAAAAAPYTPLAATYQNKIIPGMIAAYQAGHAEDIALANNMLPFGPLAQLCGASPGDKGICTADKTYSGLSDEIIKNMGINARGDAYLLIEETTLPVPRLYRLYTMGGNVPVIYNNGRFCTGWLGCAIKVPSATGSGNNNGSGNNPIIPLPGWVFPPGFTPPPGFIPEPIPAPTAAEIIWFKITNFKLQQAGDGGNYYQILKEQMAVNHENYQLNLAWGVSGATSCQASCKYVKIDDYLANQNWDDLQAQPWPCDQNIAGNVTFSGDIDNYEYGSAKTKPRELGIVRYRLSCQGETGNDQKDLIAVIQSLRWFEAIPIIDQ